MVVLEEDDDDCGEFAASNLTSTSGVPRSVVEVESVAAKASIVKGCGLISAVTGAEPLLDPVPCLSRSLLECLLLCLFFVFFKSPTI